MESSDQAGEPTTPRERVWAVVRMVLGLLQMMGAVVALYCLVATGLSELTVGAVAVTCVFMTASVLLFRRRS